MVKHRRRSTGHSAAWRCRYRAENPRGDPSWRECRVLAVSAAGVALEVPGPAPVPSERLVLDLERADTAAGIELTGQVRGVAPASKHATRIGVAFEELNDFEHGVVAILLESQPA
jgi:PilZ domain